MPNEVASFCRKPLAAVSSGLALALLISGCLAIPAEARVRHHRHAHAAAPAAATVHRGARPDRSPAVGRRAIGVPHNIAALVVDANTGRTLYAQNEHDPRGPASITKVMTLYLLFEQLEKGRLRLDSAIPISPHAAAQAPTKLGLRPGASIGVETAIQAVVTRSANDIAVAIAEAIGGDEASFAAMMTRKAHGLGMVRTHFANASGLPDATQVTTAADLALLGRAIQDHFPRYYRYFATRTFTYKRAEIRNHNHLLDRVEGMDGIKTGYTRASGFNLLAAVKRDGHHIVAVVLGGRSAGHRDRIMAELIEDTIVEGARARTAAAIPLPGGGAGATFAARAAVAPAAAQVQADKFPADRIVAPQPDPKLPFVPVSLKPGLTVDTAPVRAAGLTAPFDRSRPAYVAAAPRPRPDGAALAPPETIPRATGATGASLAGVNATATPSAALRPRALVPQVDVGSDRTTLSGRPEDPSGSAEMRRAAALRGEWMIQIAATNDLAKANDLLERAKLEGARALGGARPTTEKVQKGSETLYRARFVGLEAETAESACRTLKRSGFSCFAARD